MTGVRERRSTRGRTASAALAVGALTLGLHLPGCGSEPPEVRLRRTIEAGRDVATSGDPRGLGRLVSDRYTDDEGRDRAELLRVVQGYLSYLDPVHVIYKEEKLRVTGRGRAEVTLLVAVASVPVAGLGDLQRISAETARVELVFEDERGDWKLVRARWSPASLSDWL